MAADYVDRLRVRNAVQQDIAFLRSSGTKLYYGHGLFVKSGRTACGLPELTHWRIKHGNCWGLPFEHASGVLDFLFQVAVMIHETSLAGYISY